MNYARWTVFETNKKKCKTHTHRKRKKDESRHGISNEQIAIYIHFVPILFWIVKTAINCICYNQHRLCATTKIGVYFFFQILFSLIDRFIFIEIYVPNDLVVSNHSSILGLVHLLRWHVLTLMMQRYIDAIPLFYI